VTSPQHPLREHRAPPPPPPSYSQCTDVEQKQQFTKAVWNGMMKGSAPNAGSNGIPANRIHFGVNSYAGYGILKQNLNRQCIHTPDYL